MKRLLYYLKEPFLSYFFKQISMMAWDSVLNFGLIAIVTLTAPIWQRPNYKTHGQASFLYNVTHCTVLTCCYVKREEKKTLLLFFHTGENIQSAGGAERTCWTLNVYFLHSYMRVWTVRGRLSPTLLCFSCLFLAGSRPRNSPSDLCSLLEALRTEGVMEEEKRKRHLYRLSAKLITGVA